jgi:putative ABC transport system permease protein
MLYNYFTIARRHLLKNKVFSFINITGLSVGIAACALLALYIQDEFSYEKHFAEVDRIYRITTSIKQGDSPEERIPRTSPPVAMTVGAEFPEVEAATRIVNPPEVEQHLIRYGDKTLYEKKGYLVDSTFHRVFPLPFREGNPETALKGRSAVILSDETARKIFGNASALDETLIIASGFSVDTFRVTGVLEPFKGKSHINADFYMSINSKGWGDAINSMNTWSGQNFMFSYIRLNATASAEDLEAKFPALLEKHGGDEMRATKRTKTMHLQPLSDIHLYSNNFAFNLDLGENGSIFYIYVMASVAMFILLIACINFINLTTARATQRAGEVGIRKTMGANRHELIKQFLGESVTIVLIALVVAVGLIQMVLPFFNSLSGRSLSVSGPNSVFMVSVLVLIAVVTGIFSGSYPAFFLSAFEPAQVLRQKSVNGGSSAWLRKTLVIVQFAIAITLIASSVVIHKQLGFIQEKALGFESDYKIMIPLRTPEARSAYSTLKDEFGNLTGVRDVSGSTSFPSTPLLRDFSIYTEGNDMERAVHHFICNVDENYFRLLNIPIVAGRALGNETDALTETNNNPRIMVNRTSLTKLGIPHDDAIGTKVMYTGRTAERAETTTMIFEIVGVVEDFHFSSLHNSIDPVVFFLPGTKDSFVFMALSIDPNTYQNVLAQLENSWKKQVTATPFEFDLLSDSVARKYENDKQVSHIITIFTAIAISISCLGLYGLSIFVAERKIKEIGIRKILGASTFGIIKMLSAEFILLVGAAFFVALPVGYYAMDKWLENFAYKTNLSVMHFVVAGAVSFLVAWITVGFECIRAASSNPVDSLRND